MVLAAVCVSDTVARTTSSAGTILQVAYTEPGSGVFDSTPDELRAVVDPERTAQRMVSFVEELTA